MFPPIVTARYFQLNSYRNAGRCTILFISVIIFKKSDQHDRVKEAITAMMTKGMVDYAGIENHNIYNPREVQSD